MRLVTDRERRARLAVRHGIAPAHRHPDVRSATRAMTAWHATEAYTVHLGLTARVDGISPLDVEEALWSERSLVKQLAMRRTLFAFDPELLPAVWGSASARTAANELKGLLKAAVASGLTDEPEAWWAEVSATLLRRLAEHGPVATTELADLDPVLQGRLVVGSGRWSTEVPLAPRVLLVLGVQGRVVRVGNAGHWRLARPVWDATETALPGVGTPLESRAGYAELVRRWLWTFGPGTETDVVWWLGATKGIVRAALADVGAVRVGLESGDDGWLLPDDLDEVPEPEPWAALLPVLDPTTMGWKQRDFHLAPDDVPYLFDSNGNGGTTAWWNGRVVGCWVQDDAGRVEVLLRPGHRAEVGPEGVAALEHEAMRLTDLLDGTVIASVYKSRQMKGEALP